MAQNKKKDIFINAIEMIKFDGSHCIPTAVSYSKEGDIKIGFDAFEFEAEPSNVCNNFKIRLGDQEAGILNPKTIRFADGKQRSLHQVTNDYLKNIVQKAEKILKEKGLEKAARVLVAEPVSIYEEGSAKGSWLTNYRSHVRRILTSSFSDVDFLPEPFAVFQFYRYGVKHPLIAQKQKHVALVLDFGGGTFDVSVIETTAQGDISNSGRNSRPLAASSIAVGGFYYNKLIAESLIFKQFHSGKTAPPSYREALRKYEELQKSSNSKIQDYREDYQNFFRHFENLMYEVEKAKIAICSNLSDWSLEGPIKNSPGYQVKVPVNATAQVTEYSQIRIGGEELRQIFIERIWLKSLYPAITNALARAKSELEAQTVSIVLLSGGSSNIRWLHHLVKDSPIKGLESSELLELQEDFQEIVSKGLAIECARKTFSQGDGDFRAITYNRLCLILDPDSKGPQVTRLKPVTDGLLDKNTAGVLLPAASILESYIDLPMKWKFNLSTPPKKTLDYWFMASSFDPNDINNVHNIIDHTIRTPPNTNFDSQLFLELTVRQDGTACPRFYYRSAKPNVPELSVEGKPFAMDMTFGGASGASHAYMGIDFGTSNSSITYVDQQNIKIYEERSKDSTWSNINDFTQTLPYPIAAPLSNYLSSKSSNIDDRAREVIESFLMFGAYVAYSEYCTLFHPRSETKFFKDFTQRSAGPLLALMRNTLEKIKDQGEFSKPLKQLFEEPIKNEINELINQINDIKHNKSSFKPDFQRAIRLFANVFNQYGADFKFGYFEDVKKATFKKNFNGIFRNAVGHHFPFLDVYQYTGDMSFSEDEAILVSIETGNVLNLSPLLFWSKAFNDKDVFESELNIFDANQKGNFSYKFAGKNGSVVINHTQEFVPVVEFLNSMLLVDQNREIIKNVAIDLNDI